MVLVKEYTNRSMEQNREPRIDPRRANRPLTEEQATEKKTDFPTKGSGTTGCPQANTGI